ncbi:MLP-like protein 28 [Hibiscus trionum]|uniref:MLP-like protein 28 n=1 Tax=Hibiscus trionum TaxID=183268 RepID=A0A9W7HCZ4_HIBTR|nr:MLP-like protein 28 [Hibiscus trionum]
MAQAALKSKLEADVEIQASPQQFHHTFVSYKLRDVQHTCSDKIQGVDLQQGEWGKVGSIINWTYVHEGETKVAKDVIEAMDPDKHLITFRMIEGDLLKEHKSISLSFQASPMSGGSGSIVHLTLEYERLHDGIAHPESLQQFLVDLTKDIDAHLPQPN